MCGSETGGRQDNNVTPRARGRRRAVHTQPPPPLCQCGWRTGVHLQQRERPQPGESLGKQRRGERRHRQAPQRALLRVAPAHAQGAWRGGGVQEGAVARHERRLGQQQHEHAEQQLNLVATGGERLRKKWGRGVGGGGSGVRQAKRAR